MFDMKYEIAKARQADLRKQAKHDRAQRTSLTDRIAAIARVVLPGLDVPSGSVIPATH